MTLIIALALGAIIGVLVGLLGGGGSILAVPALVFGLGLGLEAGHPDLPDRHRCRLPRRCHPENSGAPGELADGGVFAACGVPATFAGSAVGRLLPQSVVMIGFAAVMIVAGIRMLMDRGDTGTACEVGDSGIDWRRCAPRSIPAAALVGFLTGLFGVGGGFLIIPALVLMLGLEMPVAIGTSLVIIVANSAAGLISHLSGASIDWAITAAFAGTAIVGSLVASHFGTRVDTDRLQRWFAYLVFVVAAYVLVDTIFLR